MTIGDHLRKLRLDLGLLQREVAERLGVHPGTVNNWELNRRTPALRFLPGIVRFLGYAPWAAGASVGGRLLAARRKRGLSQTAFARLLGVDPGALSRWERNLRVPTGRYLELAGAVLERFAPQRPALTNLLPPTAPQTCGALRGDSPLQSGEPLEPA